MTDPYLWLRALHIVGATILFGTGLGTAFQMWLAHRSGDIGAIAVVARNTVRADWLFTAPAVVVQPVTGAVLLVLTGTDPFAPWLVAAYFLYAIAGLCWLPVVRLQLRVRDLAAVCHADGAPLPPAYYRAMRWWFALGWPAFIAVVAIVWLMVAKPDF